MFFERACVVCDGVNGPLCERCDAALVRRPVAPGARVRSLVELDDTARAVIVAMKYRRERRLAASLARRMVAIAPHGVDVVTWVPATPSRVRQRGFDQAAEMARALGRALGVASQRVLVRQRGDVRQTGQSVDERASGPAVRSIRSATGLVLLVDDVVTTGATMRAATAAIRTAGADDVVGITFASTPRHGHPCRPNRDQRPQFRDAAASPRHGV